MRSALLGSAVLALVLMLIGSGAAGSRPVAAASWPLLPRQDAQGPSWLMAPDSGGLFVANEFSGLQRSDDGGLTWRAVSLPPEPPTPANHLRNVIAVDPTNHQTIFAHGAEGLYRTTDDAASWELVLPG